jgi:cellulose synthase/poly-beta-1,6-N-acetylglucosamine synthase-like glycosyltransferase
MAAYAALVVLAILLALLSLRGDRRLAEFTRVSLARLEAPRSWPPATVVIPVKGDDEGLAANLALAATLDYPDYELIVVARAPEDIPVDVVPARARIVIAGEGDPGSGEKVNNLLAAVRAARPESEVLAFADSDGRVQPRWLKALVCALDDTATAGLATGYRWYLPAPPDFWSLLRSVWNSAIAGGFHPGDNSFTWGGAMAIRRETFRAAHVEDYWRGAISDDYRISEAVHKAGLTIAYAPGALVVSADHTGAAEFLGWIRRQMTITRVYYPRLWWVGLFAHLVYCGSMAASVWVAASGGHGLWGEYALVAQLGLGMLKGTNRVAIAKAALPESESWFQRHGWVLTWWVPLATWVWLYSFLASAFTNTVIWRGVRYRITRTSTSRLDP